MAGTTSASITPGLLREAAAAGENDGYDRAALQSLLAAAADALELAWREKHDLMAGLSTGDEEISSRAVLLLSSAQRIADEAVSEAESYSKDLVDTARTQYREIIERAQQAAREIERQSGGSRPASEPGSTAAWEADLPAAPAFATDDLAAAGPASPDDVVRARQFTRMAAAQAHSLLESIERELGRLGTGAIPTVNQQGSAGNEG
ncbi:hypothetical protein HII28_17765 [Planctomonas sp. JC2975]|uniref:hypothetical protein n=1 Tax=Planctomonas sp. JC2975 TaxID=2729626 RepID=UPI001472967E|nr:hypothetical protein [Planctomonas sp. JC2975]NNC13715.1 hypothetical protein [Planctomonas sp. JC2975]